MQFNRLKRREFISLLGGTAAAWPLAARAQQGERMRRIGVLSGPAVDDQDHKVRLAAFQQRLQQLGWTDGHNVRIDHRFAAANLENFHKYAVELVTLAPDVILPLAPLWCISSRLPARSRSYSRSLPIRSAQVWSKVCRGQAATPLAFCCSNMI